MTSDVSFGSASVLAFGLPRFRPRCGFDGLGYYRRSITSFNELFDNTTRKRIAANPAVPRDVHADEIPIEIENWATAFFRLQVCIMKDDR